jgi:hypothetical protein
MYLDAQNLFSDAQAITASAASTNLIDFGSARDIGVGRELYLVVVVDTTFTDAGSDSTVTVTLETDDNEAFSSATAVQTIGTFAALTAAGSRLVARLQPDAGWEQYVRAYYTVANGNLTTGALTAFLTTDIQAWTAYPIGYTVS